MAFFGSTEMLCCLRASAAKSVACFRSCATSPLITISFPSGPKIWVRIDTSKVSAASISVSAAFCGVSKSITPGGATAAVDGGFDAAAFSAGCWANSATPQRHDNPYGH